MDRLWERFRCLRNCACHNESLGSASRRRQTGHPTCVCPASRRAGTSEPGRAPPSHKQFGPRDLDASYGFNVPVHTRPSSPCFALPWRRLWWDELLLILNLALPMRDPRGSLLIDTTRLLTFTSMSSPPLNPTFSGCTARKTLGRESLILNNLAFSASCRLGAGHSRPNRDAFRRQWVCGKWHSFRAQNLHAISLEVR